MEDYEENENNLLLKYESNKDGLSDQEAKKRLEKNGLNEIQEKKSSNFLVVFIKQFNDFLVLMLIASAIISFIVDKHDYFDSLIILFVVLMNAILGFIQEEKASMALKKIKSFNQFHTNVLRDKKRLKIKSSELVVGDIVFLNGGDHVPADIRILNASSLEVDESNITGESLPVYKNSKPISVTKSLGNMTNLLFSSTFILKGKALGIVIRTGMNTEIGKIAKTLDETKASKSPLKKNINKLSKIIGIAVMIICFVIYVLELISSKDILSSFKSAVSLAVAAIPEGLQAVITMVLALGVIRLSKKKTIVKNLQAVETLGAISVIAFDKTGTITTGKLNLYQGINNDLHEDNKVINDAALSSDNESNDEIELILNKKKKSTLSLVSRNPFDSVRKMSSVTYKNGNEYITYTKGAFEILFSKCINLNKRLESLAIDYANKGYRVLGVASKSSSDIKISSNESNMKVSGIILFEDEIRPEANDAILKAKVASIKPIMITGDFILTAKSIAKRVSIFDDNNKAYTKENLEYSLANKESLDNVAIFARVDPIDKLSIIKYWQDKNEVVMFAGDGVNDAAAIKASDIGISMGDGSDIAKESSNIILLDNSFKTIIDAVIDGRRIFKNIKKAISYLLASNIGEVLLILIASIIALYNPFFLTPLLPVHLLFVNLVTDSLPAIAIGLDKSTLNLEKEKPRNIKKGFFSKLDFIRMLIDGITIGLLTLFAYCIGIKTSTEYGRTMAFVTISMSQLIYSYTINSNSNIKEIFKNKYLNLSFIAGIIIILLVTYVFSDFFHFEKLSLADTIISIALSSVNFIFGIIYKKRK